MVWVLLVGFLGLALVGMVLASRYVSPVRSEEASVISPPLLLAEKKDGEVPLFRLGREGYVPLPAGWSEVGEEVSLGGIEDDNLVRVPRNAPKGYVWLQTRPAVIEPVRWRRLLKLAVDQTGTRTKEWDTLRAGRGRALLAGEFVDPWWNVEEGPEGPMPKKQSQPGSEATPEEKET